MPTVIRGVAIAIFFVIGTPAGCAEPDEPLIAKRDFDCLMELRVTVKLGTAATGVISKVTVDRGDLVKQGQVVAILDTGVQEAIVDLARVKATNEFQILAHRSRSIFLDRKAQRIQTLQNKSYATVAALEEAMADSKVEQNAEKEAILNLRLAELELAREQEILSQKYIKSPIDGVVTERVLYSGEYRSEANHLMTIAQIDPLNVEVVLPIAYYGQVVIGSTAEIHPERPVGGSYHGKVVVIDRVLDAGSGTFGVRLELPNPQNTLPAGIRCSVTFLGMAKEPNTGK